MPLPRRYEIGHGLENQGHRMNARETFTIRADDRFMEFELTRDTSFRPGEEPDLRTIIAHGDPAEAFRIATVRVRRRN